VRLLRRSLRRDLAARRAQFVAVGVTILLGVALFGASYDAFQNLTASYQGLYDDLRFADLTITGGPADAVAARLADEPGVAAVATRTVADVPIDAGGHRFLGRVVGMPSSGDPPVDRVRVLRGTGLDPAQKDGILVEQHMAATFHLEPGDTIEVLGPAGWRQATVVGVVASPEYLWPARSRQAVLVPFEEFGVTFGLESFAAASPPGTTHAETLVRLAPDAPAGTLDRLTAVAIAAGASATMTRVEQPSNAALQEDVSGFGELSLAFPLLFLGAGALAMAVLLGRMVATHRAQIGILRASGFGRRTILAHYLGFGLLVGLAGSIPGAILGGFAAALITGLYTGVLSIPTSVVDVRPATVAIGILIGPVAGVLAALGPARRAASTSPAEAMHGAAPIGLGTISLAERLLPPLRRLPIRWLVALRGLGRNRSRSLSTVLGIVLATSLIFVSWAFIDTVQILLDRQFVQIQREDATVVLAQPVPASRVASTVANDDIAASEPELAVSVTVIEGSRRYATTMIGLVPGTTMRTFQAQDGRPLALGEDGALLGSALRDRLGLEVGDTVSVEPLPESGTTGPASQMTTVRVAGFIDEPFGTYAYASLSTTAGVAGLPAADPPVTSALVRYRPGVDRQAARDLLTALPGVAAVVDSRGLYDTAQSFMGLFYAFVGVMLVLGGVMAFALIFNTLSANVMERAVELTALRTLGMSPATIGRLGLLLERPLPLRSGRPSDHVRGHGGRDPGGRAPVAMAVATRGRAPGSRPRGARASHLGSRVQSVRPPARPGAFSALVSEPVGSRVGGRATFIRCRSSRRRSSDRTPSRRCPRSPSHPCRRGLTGRHLRLQRNASSPSARMGPPDRLDSGAATGTRVPLSANAAPPAGGCDARPVSDPRDCSGLRSRPSAEVVRGPTEPGP
jgi:putative ABC transport system permease protein